MWLAILLLATQQPAEPTQPRCTLRDELPVLVFVAENPLLASDVKIPGVRGKDVNLVAAALGGLERHRLAHGSWPSEFSSESLQDARSVACDPVALDVLRALAIEHSFGADAWFGLPTIAELFERNERFVEAEEILEIAVREDENWRATPASVDFAHFLVRRGRFSEAWPLLEGWRPTGLCGVCDTGRVHSSWTWIELCFRGLHGGQCLDELTVLRYERVGLESLGAFLGEQFVAHGSGDPVSDAREIFERVLAPTEEPRWLLDRRLFFLNELADWAEERQLNSRWSNIDWTTEGGISFAMARAKELAKSDRHVAYWLLKRAATTGSAAAGHALRNLGEDPATTWSEAERGYLLALWRTGLLTRTNGAADPDDPATW